MNAAGKQSQYVHGEDQDQDGITSYTHKKGKTWKEID
jgi:hypothetical protein